ncbi:hypothetical protein PAI11_43200 [Patulibacter medicamentivorans]|uniref:Uncharacterized protein n=1 Tax=Patulibacter medicamentivorans TaxID=1097667 RepID=H0EBT7_9ACTN|nr:hypothetical protein PAI11_43200 [Patulibacter medicamentivorans]
MSRAGGVGRAPGSRVPRRCRPGGRGLRVASLPTAANI